MISFIYNMLLGDYIHGPYSLEPFQLVFGTVKCAMALSFRLLVLSNTHFSTGSDDRQNSFGTE